MLRPVVTEIVVLEPAKHDTVVGEQARPFDLAPLRPARRSISGGVAAPSAPPDRHPDGDHDGGKPARAGDQSGGVENLGRIGVETEPPPDQLPRPIDRLPERSAEPRVGKEWVRTC